MQGFTSQKRRIHAVPLTPLIDVVFLLVVFFMLTSSFVITESLELALPSVKEASLPAGKEKPIVVRMLEKGGLSINNRQIIPESLQSTLEDLLIDNGGRRIVLFSAPDANVQELVSVVDQIYMAGGRNISVLDAEGRGAF